MTNRLFRLVARWCEYICVFLLSLLPFLWFSGGYVLLGHDAGFRLDYASQLSNLWYSWDPKINFGMDWSLFKGFLVTQLPEIGLSFFTDSFELGQKLSLVFWFAVMGVGMLVFLRNVFPQKQFRFLRIFSSVFYMYNIFVLSGWVIGERARFSLFAALPVGLLLIYNTYVKRQPMLRNGTLFALLYFFFNGGGVLPMYGGTIVALGFAIVYLSIQKIKRQGWPGFWFGVKVLAAFIIPFLLINAYYIVPNIALLRSSYGSSLGAQGGIEGLILWERMISRFASVFNLLRLQGMPTWHDPTTNSFLILYQTNPIFVAASFIPIISIVFGVFSRKLKGAIKQQSTVITFLLLLLPVGLVFTMGTHPPTGILYEFAMKKIPGFVMFRSSIYKFAPALWFPMIVLSGYYLNQLIYGIRNLAVRLLISILLITGLITYHFPFFTTEIFKINDVYTTRVRLPEYVPQMGATIKQTVSEQENILVMPKMPMYFPDLPVDIYTWNYFSLDMLPRNAANRRFIANDSKNHIVKKMYQALYDGDLQLARQLMAIAHIDYILWRGDAVVDSDHGGVTQSLKELLDTNFASVSSHGPWILYKTDLPNKEPQVFATNTARTYIGSDEAAVYLVETEPSGRELLVEKNAAEPIQPMYQRQHIEAECIMCAQDEFQKLVDSIVLPTPRITPASLVFPFEVWREKRLADRVRNDAKARIDADLALAQKYLSYAQVLRDKKFVDTYTSYITDAIHQWENLDGRDRNVYAIRLLAYITAHHRILSKSNVFDAARVLSELANFSQTLSTASWMTQAGQYRYLVTVDTKGNYQLSVYPRTLAVGVITVDGHQYQTGSSMPLEMGLHTIEVRSSNLRPYVFLESKNEHQVSIAPIVTFARINPTEYRVHVESKTEDPFILVLKESYDPRWKADIKGAHVKVDGFANGWVVRKKGQYDIILYYEPQKAFYLGLAITGISFITIGLLAATARLKSKRPS